jgi:uncharacterized membrane protein (DUF2068 family)
VPDGPSDVIIRIDLVTPSRHQKEKTRTGRNVGAAVQSRGLWLVAVYKLFRGLVLLAVGFGTVKLLHKGTAFEFDRWADILRVDPNNFYIHRLLHRLSFLDERTLKELSVGTFFYSALDFIEGTGLLLRKRWAAYFTIITTASFIPLEVYEIARRVSPVKFVVLLLNVAVVAYLVIEVRRNRRSG